MKKTKFTRQPLRYTALLLTLLLTLLLAACNGSCGKGGNDKPSPEEPEEPKHVCEFGEWEDVIIPTCSSEGKIQRKCECGEVETKITPKKEHDLTEIGTKAPTCTEPGYDAYVFCSVCDYTTYKEIKPSHALVPVKGVEATCKSEGYADYEYCTECDYTTYQVLPVLPHLAVSVPRKDPTCLGEGHEAYEYCPNCDYTTYVPIPANGHSTVNVQGKAPSCTEGGYTDYEYCTKCEYTTYTPVSELGHSLNFAQPLAPTCTSGGHNAYEYCTECDYTTYEYLAPEHKLETVSAKAPTCTSVGWNEYQRCTLCSYTEYEELPLAKHVVISVGAKAPTCTEDGHNAYQYCNNCSYNTYEVIRSSGHSIKNAEAKAKTCYEHGWDAYEYCSVCDYTTYKEIPASHNPISVSGKASTCLEKGYADYEYCADCGDYTTYEELPFADHRYSIEWTVDLPATPDVFGIRSHHCIYGCGEKTDITEFEYYSEGLIFAPVSGGYSVALGTASGDIYIPDFYMGLPVISVAESGFENAEIDSIRLSSYTQSIGENAFALAKIKSDEIVFPDTLQFIDYHAFYLADVSTADFGFSSPKIEYFGAVASFAVIKVDTLENWLDFEILSGNLCSVGFHLYVGGELLTDAVIPDDVIYPTNAFAFSKVAHMNSITIGKNTGLTNFNCKNLIYKGTLAEWCAGTTIVQGEYENFIIDGSVVEGSLTIPEGVVSIRENAFANAPITSVKLPSTLLHIGDGAFENTLLSSVDLPDGLLSLGNKSFANTAITVFTIPENLETFGVSVLFNMGENVDIYYNAKNAQGSDFLGVGFTYTLTIGDKVESIPENAFSGNLTAVTFSDKGNLKKIGARAITSQGDAVRYIVIPAGINEIGEGLFEGVNVSWAVNLSGLPTAIRDYVPISYEAPRYIGDSAFIKMNDEWVLVDYFGSSLDLVLPEFDGGERYCYDPAYVEWTYDIRSLTLPASVYVRNGDEFEQYSSLEELTVETSPASFNIKNNRTIRKVILGAGLVELPQYAFGGCENLEQIILPEGLLKIGENAFDYCHKLNVIVLPASVTTFDFLGSTDAIIMSCAEAAPLGSEGIGFNSVFVYGVCDLVTENGFMGFTDKNGKAHIYGYVGEATDLVIDKVCGYPIVEICNAAFMNKTSLRNVVIGNSVERIGERAFDGCYAIHSVTLGTALKEILGESFNAAFYGSYPYMIINNSDLDITFSSGDKFGGVASGAFIIHNSDGVSYRDGEFVTKDGVYVEYIGESTDLVINYEGSEPLYIGDLREAGKSITSITVIAPNTSEIEILPGAFKNCETLKAVVINSPATVDIELDAFSGCINLTSVQVSKLHTAPYAFAGCTSLSEVIISDRYFYDVGKYSFLGCTALTEIDLGNVGVIGEGAFKNCTSLTTVKLDELPDVLAYAFSGCSSLTSLVYGASAFSSSVHEYAFEDCVMLEEFNVYDATVYTQAFVGCTSLKKISMGKDGDFYDGGSYENQNILSDLAALESLEIDEDNERWSSVDGVLYNITPHNNSASIYAVLPYASGVITIPGYVKSVSLYIFDKFDSVTGFILEEGVEYVYAPEEIYDSLSIPSTVTEISDPTELFGSFAFVSIDKDNERYICEDGVLYDLSDGCIAVAIGRGAPETLKLLDRTTAIAERFLCDGNTVKVLIIPDSVVELNLNAFDNSYNEVRVLVLGSGIERIEGVLQYRFDIVVNNSKVSDIYMIDRNIIASAVGEYKVKDGAFGYVIADGMPIVIEYVGEKTSEVVFPDEIEGVTYGMTARFSDSLWLEKINTGGIEILYGENFKGCEKLSEVVFGNVMREIMPNTFAYCTGLKEIVFPESIEHIWQFAFFMCSGIERVEFVDYDKLVLKKFPSYSTAHFLFCPETAGKYFVELLDSEWNFICLEG